MEKIAIIDLGSNSARLVLVHVNEFGNFMVFDELKESVRLGQDMVDGFLKRTRIDQTVKTLKMFKRLCDANGIEKIFAYATAAVRRAKNQKSFLEEVSSACNIDLKVLSQEEEAIYCYQGVVNSLDIPKGLIVDIGGGSTQFIYYNRRNILAIETIPYGSVTLTDLFAGQNLSPEDQALKIEDFIKERLSEFSWIKNLDPDTQLIGVGGSFRNLGKISRKIKKYPLDMAHNYNITTAQFSSIYDTIKTLDLDKTMKIKGLSSDRADIFPTALAIINSIVDECRFESITISGAGLREGAIFRYAVPTTVEKPITDVLGHSIYGMLRFFGANIEHAEHVYNLSIQLYKQLKVLHKLPRVYVKILRTASLLHDAGARLKYYDHQKHSCYIILNSNLYGIAHKELIMAAFIAAAHRKGDPFTAEFAKYRNLFNDEEMIAMNKLGVILKIAESFDRTQSGLITGLSCDVLGDSVIMKTESEGDVSLEIKDAISCQFEFRKAYHKNLEIL